MPKTGYEKTKRKSKCLLIGSTASYSGKTATILGIANQLQALGMEIAYSKPLGTCWSDPVAPITDEDAIFLSEQLKLPPELIGPTLLFLQPETIEKRLRGEDQTDYTQSLLASLPAGAADLVLLEGPSTLVEGSLFNLSLRQMSELADASVLLVARFHTITQVEELLAAKRILGSRLLGIVLNDIPNHLLATAKTIVAPFLELEGIPIFGILAASALLRSVSVGELAGRLNAEVVCRPDKLNLMVESLKIGAMNINAALKYFYEGQNMAVVTGGDRTDIQLAALETSTQCLILTGQVRPVPAILSRAEEVEVPVLCVDLDTLTTVEIIEQTLGQVRLHEPTKLGYIKQLMAEHFQYDRLIAAMGLATAAV